MTPSRRDFFRMASTVPLLPASWTAFASSLSAAGGDTASESYWLMVKRQFPLEDKLIYMNAANVCPVSRPVMDRHLEYLRDFHANPSFQNRGKYVPLRESLRGKIASLLRVASDEIAITRNTSEGSNIVVNGVDLKAGDEVVITSHNHPSNNDSWKVRARRDKFVVKSVPVPVPASSVDDLIGGIERAITPRTRVIAITHVTNTTGILYPAKQIAELARRRGIYMHLDGAQTFGALDVNLKDIGCDSYSTSAHKWPMGPLEAGVLFVRAERIAELWPSIVTAGWADDLKGARKFEVFGQRDDPRVVALDAAIDFLNLIGAREIEARLRALTTRAKMGLKNIAAVELKTNLEPELSGGVVKFRIKSAPTKQAYDTLWEKHRMGIAMTASGDSEGLRFSPHVYNSMEEIDRAVSAVKSLA
ncbi:MAG: aminotransferase class V-fold PLP-dependent enzyme [Bryobacteraceae bacterium]